MNYDVCVVDAGVKTVLASFSTEVAADAYVMGLNIFNDVLDRKSVV